MKQEQLFNIAKNVEDFSAATGFRLEFTVGNEYSLITETQGNVDYYMDEIEAVRMEKYEYFSASLMCVINQSQLRKGYIQNKLNDSNSKAIKAIKINNSHIKEVKEAYYGLFKDFMNKPELEV